MGATKESSWSFGIFAASAAGALACCETGCHCGQSTRQGEEFHFSRLRFIANHE
jgi:hypothetical protein